MHAARPAARRFVKWQLLYWSQTAAVMFNVAALVTAVMLVTFSDLAFGWSTTLDVPAATASRIVQAIASPWASFAPLAVPSPELVEQSQFFRLERARCRGRRGARARRVVAIHSARDRDLRLAAAPAAARTRHRAVARGTGALLLEDSRVTALLDRMASPAIETAADSMSRRRRSISACHGGRPADDGHRSGFDLGKQPARRCRAQLRAPPSRARSSRRRRSRRGEAQRRSRRARAPRGRERGRTCSLHAGVGTAAARASRFSRGAAAAHRSRLRRSS